jgi:hypothetical protein
MEAARPKPLAGSVHDSPTALSAGTPRQRGGSGFMERPGGHPFPHSIDLQYLSNASRASALGDSV